jgi:chemotaxis protein histidine kinase CheA
LRHEQVLPLLSLAETLGIAHDQDEPAIVTIDGNGRRLAMTVREVLGVRKIVVRPLDGLPPAEGLYLGGAMMGDGAVVLIVNPDALLTSEPSNA